MSFFAFLRSWRYLFIFLGVVLGVALFYAEENWRGERAWEKHRQELAAHGQVSDGAALVPAPVADSQNFAMTPFLLRTLTQRALPAGFAPWHERASNAIKPEKTPRTNLWTRPRTDLAAWYAAFLNSTNAATRQALGIVSTNFNFPRAEAAAGVLSALAECEPVLEELREASQRPFCRFDLSYHQENPATILLPHLAPLKHLCSVLQLRASAELALGRTDESLEDIELTFRLADALQEEPFLISQLVRITEFHIALQPLVEGLAAHQWSEPQLKTIEARLRRFDFCADGRRTLEADCLFFGCRIAEYLRRHPGAYINEMANSGEGLGANLAGVLVRLAPSGWFDFEKRNCSRMFQESILPAFDPANHRVSPALCVNAEERITALRRHSPAALILRHEMLSALLLENRSGFVRRTAFMQTGADLVAVACALERHRLAQGRYPETLESLASQWPGQLPRDIINGQPLKYHCTADDHFTLYSVGWDEKDDGGLVRLNKSGEGVDLEEGDWVFQ